MTQIEKIKAEIERRINYLNKYKDFTETAASARQELIYLQSFIELMEKEQDSRYDDDSPKIKGWVARDEDKSLYFYKSFPKKDGCWYGDEPLCIERKVRKIYPELSFEDEPIEVELTISRVSKAE